MAITVNGSTISMNSGASVNDPSGSAPCAFVRAWIQLNGRTGAIIGSFNVSSASRTFTGRYVVNFSTGMSSGNYAVNVTTKIDTGDYDPNGWTGCVYRIPSNPATGSVTVGSYYAGSGGQDCDQIHVIVSS